MAKKNVFKAYDALDCPGCAEPVPVKYENDMPVKCPVACPWCGYGVKMMASSGEDSSFFYLRTTGRSVDA